MSDSLKDRLEAVENQSAELQATKDKIYPPGWQPGVVWEGNSGQITTPPVDEPPSSWEEWLVRYGLDPEIHVVEDDKVRFTAWDGWKRDTPDGPAYSAVQFSFRAQVTLKKEYDTVDYEDLYKEILAQKKSRKKTPTGESALIILLSDWQTGNDGDGGAEGTVESIAELVTILPDHISDTRKIVDIGEIVVMGMGDLVEGTCNFYPNQEFTVELDRREQIKVVRRGIRDVIMAVHPHAEQMTVGAVGGNHGENRAKGSRTLTSTKADNDDVAVFEALAEGFAMNPTYENIHWKIPREQLAISHRIGDQIVAFTHGHIAKYRSTPMNTMWEWWKNQAYGRHFPGVADADILVAAHYHHLNIKQQENRTLMIAPSLRRVSAYFGDYSGLRTVPGTLTFVVTPDGWDLPRVI